MTEIVKISKKNESYIYIDCDHGILMELSEEFSFYVDGYKHMPKYKMGVWSGKIYLLDTRFGTLPYGLLNQLLECIDKLGYTAEISNDLFVTNDINIEEVCLFINSLNIHSNGNKLEVREYQIRAVYNCIKNNRQISVTPTGGGKSLIAYCLYRWYLYQGKDHFMLVVPNLSLIKQMYSDFIDYSSHNGFDVEGQTQIIAEGREKQIIANRTLHCVTWQSIYKMPSKWFNMLDVILMDETHIAKAAAVKGIFEKATEVKYRFGITGSLDKSSTNKMVLRGLIGEISKVKSTRELIDEGYLSDVKITCVVLKYGKESSKLVNGMSYQKEIDFLCQHERRNSFISKLALEQTGNTLILFSYVEAHGEPLYEEIKANATTQNVHFVAGKVEADDRERIRNLIQNETGDSVTVASIGTMSTGVNIPNLHNIIFASPTKSVIRVIQSLGRGLRKADGKTHLKLFDLADMIVSSKTKPNHTMRHFVERLKIYVDEKHKYKIIEVNIE